MTVVLALTTGGLVTLGVYLMLRRSMINIAFGLVLLGHAANLLIFTLGGLVRGAPPIALAGESAPATHAADPLPQALVLTAIVIGFAVVAFVTVLLRETQRSLGTSDVDEMRAADP
jgi:multicomponent Na+:H+ antiporter subunit C